MIKKPPRKKKAFHRIPAKFNQVINISHTLVDNKLIDHSDVVGASSVGAALITSLFST